MCMIGFLFPMKPRKRPRKPKAKRSSHRRTQSSNIELPLRHEKDDLKALSLFSENTLTLLHVSLEQYSLQEQEWLERDSPAFVSDRRPPDSEAQPTGLEYDRRWQSTIERQIQTRMAGPPERRAGDSLGRACCCCSCGCATEKPWMIPGLSDSRVRRAFKVGTTVVYTTMSGVATRRHQVWAVGGPPPP
ncbi:hypothetical protein MMYC01_200538 [Madurella mycetomatis]|uniref:Uncharacterized protein n=1 Tax=Madurella mycetomatis TaxID=100816 RepID=A0A175WIW6_9PEZI|nr:hypothetical protein MMYC01_200538 [Madurella mycetomatis]